MKKTFTINIGGGVFHIEEDAFEKLQNYLQKLNNLFACQKGGQEILQDIEARIAELLQTKIREKQEVIIVGWVDEVMKRMGTPEDFMDQEQAECAADPNIEKVKKRMYRDGENRVLGGVCSGMSAYFNFDPIFLRILFVLLAFIGAGISVIVYLILWIVVPKARTTAQRLEMKGEEATIPNIQKTIQEEVQEVKNSFSKINKSDSFQRGKEVANKTAQASVEVMKSLGKAVGVAFGSLLILIGFVGFVTFLVSMAVGNTFLHSHSVGFSQNVDMSGFLGFIVSPGLVSVSLLLVVLLIGIPLLAILFLGTKLVFRYKTNNKLIGLGAFGIWLVTLVTLIGLSAGQVGNFSQKSSVSAVSQINSPACTILNLELGFFPEAMEEEKNARFENFTLFTRGNEKVLAGNPHLQIEATEASDFSVIIKRTARGKNGADVQRNLENIQYNITSKDSTLILDPYFTIASQGKWRNQEVQVVVKVPVGKLIHLGANLDQLNFDFENIDNVWNMEMTGKTWKMTPEGLSLKE